MERKFESQLGKRIQEGKKRGCAVNLGVVAVAVVSFSLLMGSAAFLLSALAGGEIGKPVMDEYMAITGEDDYLIYVSESEELVHDDGDDLTNYDLRRIVNLKEKTYTSPNSPYFKEYNSFVYNVNVVLRDLSEVGIPEGMVLGTLMIPYTGEITTQSMSITVNQIVMAESIVPATITPPNEEDEVPCIFIEVFLPELTWIVDEVEVSQEYAEGDNVQIQASVKVPFFHDLYPDESEVPVPVPDVVEEAFPEFFDLSDLPVADAGENMIVVVGEDVELDGSGSTDDASIVSYVWTYFDGELIELSGVTVTLSFSSAGDYIVVLTVMDEDGLTDIDGIRITVLPQPDLLSSDL